MKSNRALKSIFLGGTILALLVLLSLGLASPQARSTGKPPEPVYGIRLPDQANAFGLNAYGKYPTTNDDNDVYWHDGVNVLAGVVRYKNDHTDQIYFVVDRTTPANWAALQGIVLDPTNYTITPGTEQCGFPGLSGGTAPLCVQQFLNQPHPLEDYDHIQFRIHIFTFLEDIPFGVKYPLCNGDWGVIYLWTKSECDEAFPPPYSPYHRITAKFSTSDDYAPGGDGGRLYIERLNANTWRIYVEAQRFSIKEYYCKHELSTGKGKSYYINKTYTSFEGCAYPVSYTMDLVKK